MTSTSNFQWTPAHGTCGKMMKDITQNHPNRTASVPVSHRISQIGLLLFLGPKAVHVPQEAQLQTVGRKTIFSYNVVNISYAIPDDVAAMSTSCTDMMQAPRMGATPSGFQLGKEYPWHDHTS